MVMPLSSLVSCRCRSLQKINISSCFNILGKKGTFPGRIVERGYYSYCHWNQLHRDGHSLDLLGSSTRNFSTLSRPCLVPVNVSKMSGQLNAQELKDLEQSKNVDIVSGESNKIQSKGPARMKSHPETDENSVLKSEFAGTNWITIYKFSHIRTARIIQRLKLYQTAFTCCFAVPTALGCWIYGHVGFETVTLTGMACGLACGMLYLMGNFFSRLIGFIYVSEDNPDIVRVAHMTFWGTRKDDMYNKTDFIPFSELPDNISDVYIHIKTYDEPDNKLYLSLRYGEVLHRHEFESIFGHVSEFISRKSMK